MQGDIAEQLSVARQPVLQALRLLRKDNFVLDALGRGVLGAPLDVAVLVQIYQLRSTLDALAAKLAAQTRCVLDAQPITQGRLAAQGTDIKAMMTADAALHTAVYAASGNWWIGQTAQTHWHRIRRAMGAVLQVSTMRESIWDEHEAIAKAIAHGNEIGAETLTRQHGEDAGRNLAFLLTEALLNTTKETS